MPLVVVPPPPSLNSPHHILFLSSNGSGGGDGNDSSSEEERIDKARQQLESLLGADLDDSSADEDTPVDLEALMDPRNTHCIADILPPQPPLTSSERDRRLAEMEILADLEDSVRVE